MSLTIKPDCDLTPLNTLGITATADYLIPITEPQQLSEATKFAAEKKLPLFVLGGGSNIVLGRSALHCVALKIEIPGRQATQQTDDATIVTLGAGENWDEFVEWSVAHSLRGIESLSLIPGTVGAAPVQNVGAYGQEVSETITEVAAFDLKTGTPVRLANADCGFGYRDSLFKHEGKGRYVITHVTFRLVPQHQAAPPTYASLQAELDRRGVTEPSVQDIRSAVIAIRRSKLPDPAKIPTAGSFFHNVVVTPEVFQQLQQANPDIPHWSAAQGHIKIPSSWLVEQCGLKGVLKDGVGTYEKQAIAVINPGHRPAKEVLAFRDRIIDAVRDRFGVTLTMEPELVEF